MSKLISFVCLRTTEGLLGTQGCCQHWGSSSDPHRDVPTTIMSEPGATELQMVMGSGEEANGVRDGWYMGVTPLEGSQGRLLWSLGDL